MANPDSSDAGGAAAASLSRTNGLTRAPRRRHHRRPGASPFAGSRRTSASGFARRSPPTSPDSGAPREAVIVIARAWNTFRRRGEHGAGALALERIEGVVIHPRRVAASLMSLLFFLQVTLAGGGLVCPAHDHGGMAGGHASTRRAAHAMMRMTVVAPSATPRAIVLSTPAPAHCDMAGLAGECASMVSCSPAASIPQRLVRATLQDHAAARPADRTLAPPSRTTAPELPPPRA